MARSIHPGPRFEERLEMTPMIDVTFLLLLFFLLTPNVRTLEGRLEAYLPKKSGAPSCEELVCPVEIRIRLLEPGPPRSLAYHIGPRRAASLAQLEGPMQRFADFSGERAAILDVGPGVRHCEVVGVIDLALEAGFREIEFTPPARP